MVYNPEIITLPTHYSSLPYQHIKISHVPASSPTPTRVLLLELHRPGKNNAFTDQMSGELEKAFELFDIDDRVKAIVVTGSGKMFCAGADLEIGFAGGKGKAGSVNVQKAEKDYEHRDGGGRVTLSIHRCRKPTIMAINGHAVGIGATMTLPASIRIASATAKIGFVFARRGIIMEAASHFFLPRLIGTSRAMHLVTTGGVYPASHPLLSQLFSEILPNGEATIARGLELAHEIADNTSAVSTALMRDMMYRGADSAEGAHLLDSKLIYGLFGSRDNEEGIKSFFEKRPARFEGTLQDDAPAVYPWWEPVDTTNRPKPILAGKSKL